MAPAAAKQASSLISAAIMANMKAKESRRKHQPSGVAAKWLNIAVAWRKSTWRGEGGQ